MTTAGVYKHASGIGGTKSISQHIYNPFSESVVSMIVPISQMRRWNGHFQYLCIRARIQTSIFFTVQSLASQRARAHVVSMAPPGPCLLMSVQ